MAKCVGARYSRGAVARQQYGVAPPWPLGYTALATRSFERHRIAARGVRHRRGTAGWLVGRRFATGLIRAVRVAPHTCRCTSQRCGDDAACPRLTPQRGGDLSHCHRRHRMSRRCRKSVTKMSQWCREMSRKCHKNVTDLGGRLSLDALWSSRGGVANCRRDFAGCHKIVSGMSHVRREVSHSVTEVSRRCRKVSSKVSPKCRDHARGCRRVEVFHGVSAQDAELARGRT